MVLARRTGWDAPPRIKDAPGGLQSWAKGVGMIAVPAQLSQSRFYPEANYPALLAFWENFNPRTRVPSQLSSCALELLQAMGRCEYPQPPTRPDLSDTRRHLGLIVL